MELSSQNKSATYTDFYTNIFLPEHKHKVTILTHVLGTLLGIFWLLACFASGHYFWLLLFPLVHAAAGLIGHRLAERNEAVGDIRVTRKDFPLWWFIRANHQLTLSVILKREHRLR
jgi:hypothetical protein